MELLLTCKAMLRDACMSYDTCLQKAESVYDLVLGLQCCQVRPKVFLYCAG